MTRSISGPLTPLFLDPESAFPKKKQDQTNTTSADSFSNSEPSDQGTNYDTNTHKMADIANMTLEEYATQTTQTFQMGVVRPTIPNNTNFELKGHILHMLREIPFNGNEYEDAHNHVDEVLEIADYVKVPGVSEDLIMLRIFPITKKGKEKKWLKSQPLTEMDTWAKMIAKFLKQFSPPARIAKLKSKNHGLNRWSRRHSMKPRLGLKIGVQFFS